MLCVITYTMNELIIIVREIIGAVAFQLPNTIVTLV